MKLARIGCALAFCLTMASQAHAGLIVDTVVIGQKVALTYAYEHDLLDNGFTPGTAMSGNLAIEIYDDAECDLDLCFDEWIPELLLVTVDSFDFDTGGLTFGDFVGDLEVNGLASLNDNGRLNVRVSSVGDFVIGNSVLTVDVPEPGTLALFGMGLALTGLGAARRRQQ